MSSSLLVITDPVSKPRQTQRDKWAQRPCVLAYRRYADKVRAEAKSQKFTLPESNAFFEFGLPMPKSWRQGKRLEMVNSPHRQKPDLDNLIKAVMDALCEDDCAIWSIAGAEKHWSASGFVSIRILPLRQSTSPPIEMGRGV